MPLKSPFVEYPLVNNFSFPSSSIIAPLFFTRIFIFLSWYIPTKIYPSSFLDTSSMEFCIKLPIIISNSFNESPLGISLKLLFSSTSNLILASSALLYFAKISPWIETSLIFLNESVINPLFEVVLNMYSIALSFSSNWIRPAIVCNLFMNSWFWALKFQNSSLTPVSSSAIFVTIVISWMLAIPPSTFPESPKIV